MITPDLIKTINKNFIIRMRWEGAYKSKLVGAGQYAKRLNDPRLAEKHFNDVLTRGVDKHTFALRRGVRIDFYSR